MVAIICSIISFILGVIVGTNSVIEVSARMLARKNTTIKKAMAGWGETLEAMAKDTKFSEEASKKVKEVNAELEKILKD